MACYLTKNFTLEEMYASSVAKQRGIVNTVGGVAAVNLMHLAEDILQPLRDAMGVPITIGSGYRCSTLNIAVGGARGSQHLTGQAVDICIDGDTTKGRRYFDWIRTHCVFDQLIWEHNSNGSYWVHVSYVYGGRNRCQVINDMLQS